MGVTKKFDLPLAANHPSIRLDAPLYYVLPLDQNGETEWRPVYGKKGKADPGEVFAASMLTSPAHVAKLLDEGRVKKCGVWKGVYGEPELDPWFRKELERTWNAKHVNEPILTDAEREEVTKKEVLYHAGPQPERGADVYRAVRKITTHFHGVLSPGALLTADVLVKSVRAVDRLLTAAIESGQLQHVGTVSERGKFDPLPADLVPEIQSEEGPQRMKIDLHEVIGTVGANFPLYVVESSFDGFTIGQLATPDGLYPGLPKEEKAEKIKALVKAKKIRVIGRWTYRHGLIFSDEDDFQWSEPKTSERVPAAGG